MSKVRKFERGKANGVRAWERFKSSDVA